MYKISETCWIIPQNVTSVCIKNVTADTLRVEFRMMNGDLVGKDARSPSHANAIIENFNTYV
jgi:hypothetical protein